MFKTKSRIPFKKEKQSSGQFLIDGISCHDTFVEDIEHTIQELKAQEAESAISMTVEMKMKECHKKGHEEGRAEKLLGSIRTLMQNLHLPAVEAMNTLSVLSPMI